MNTVSIELAKELKEAGFPQGGLSFNWIMVDGEYRVYHVSAEFRLIDYKSSVEKVCSAPTAEEILESLPVFVQFEKESLPFSFRIEKEIGGDFPDEFVVLYVRYSKTINSERDYQERGRTTNESLAEAAGKMWLYLKRNNLL